MFKHLNTTLIALGCIFAMTGCIHKDYPPCQPLTVNLVVADKNYSNVKDIDEEDALDERLPFHSYVPTACYILRNSQTGEIVSHSGIIETTQNDFNHTITFPEDLPHGKYDMIVWGGLKSLGTLEFDDDPATAAFNSNDDTEEDIYLGYANIDYGPYDNNNDLLMKRTMGKLIVVKELVGRAEGVNRTQKVISEIRHHIDLQSNYDGTHQVVINNSFTPAPKVISKNIVAPSVNDGKTRFHIEFFNDTPNTPFPVLVPEDVRISIRPNEITVLRYVYNPEIEDFDIYIKKKNSWEFVYDLDFKD